MRPLGNLLIAASLLGFVGLGLIAADVTPPWARGTAPAVVAPPASRGAVAASLPAAAPVAAPITAPTADASAPPVPSPTDLAVQPPAAPAAVEATEEPRRPIERIVVPRIGLDASVVPARLVDRGGALSWEIPAHRAGHADGTAGAGARGNAVLLGHVDSLRSGDVFRNLEKVALGDSITVWSADRAYTYRVAETKSVERTDTGMVGTTETASLTLVTCAGAWSPALWDYTERFVVRAELREVSRG